MLITIVTIIYLFIYSGKHLKRVVTLNGNQSVGPLQKQI
jgi:hypothetical protein